MQVFVLQFFCTLNAQQNWSNPVNDFKHPKSSFPAIPKVHDNASEIEKGLIILTYGNFRLLLVRYSLNKQQNQESVVFFFFL